MAYVVSTSMKLSFAVFAFLSFGANTDAVILNSLPAGPVHITVGSFFALNCILSYGLTIYPLFESVHKSVTISIQNNTEVAHAFYSFQPLIQAENMITENNKITNAGMSIK